MVQYMHKKLEAILNSAFPTYSGISFRVDGIASEQGYKIAILRNNKEIDKFFMSHSAVYRLTHWDKNA